MVTDRGRIAPVTVIEVAPNVVIQVRTKEKDGYEAVQIGTGTTKKLSKAQKGHMKDLGNFRVIREFRATAVGEEPLKVGDKIEPTIFQLGDVVKVSGISKGKGFAGGMKRHGFHGMPMGHGHKHVARHIGSIGQRFPQHTLKGKKMAGRMGADRITIRGLKVVEVDAEQGVIALKGSVPGNNGTVLEIVSIS